MAQLAVVMAGLLLIAKSKASDEVDRSALQGFLTKYVPSGSDASKSSTRDYDKLITPELSFLHPATQAQGSLAFTPTRGVPTISTKDFDEPKIRDREESQAVQKLLANGSNNPTSLSAIGIGLLSLVTMLVVHLRRGLQSAANLASSDGLGLDMPMNTSPALGDNVMEMKSHDQDLKNSAAVFETRALHTVNSSSVGWGQLSSKHSRPKTVCCAERRPPLHNRRRRVGVVMMGRKFENNKVKMAKTAAANAKKSSYIGKKIKVAVKAGGPDPDANRALGLIIKEAQALNVKREIVDRNIKAASSDKDGADFKELTYELYGHGGVGFVINALSDNSNRAYTDVGTVAKKAALKLAESGSVLHNFEKKGRLAVNSALDEDELIELALENDVDDVAAAEPDPDGMRADGEDVKTVAWVQASDLGAMQKALVDAGHDCTANLVHEPMMLVECNEEDMEKNLRVLDRLEEVDDVDTVEHNMAL